MKIEEITIEEFELLGTMPQVDKAKVRVIEVQGKFYKLTNARGITNKQITDYVGGKKSLT